MILRDTLPQYERRARRATRKINIDKGNE